MNKQINDIFSMNFKRKCSANFFKNLKMKLGEMSFSKDWVNDTRGDMYPIIKKSGCLEEKIEDFVYRASSESAFECERLLGQHFPYANYELTFSAKDCECGFAFRSPKEDAVCKITVKKAESGKAQIVCCHTETEYTDTDIDFSDKMTLIVSTLGNRFFIYLKQGKFPKCVAQTVCEKMADIKKMSVFNCSTAALYMCSETGGAAIAENVEFYLDCGISQADIRPIRFEDGTPYMSDGKVFFTMSSRLEAQQYQTVISLKPGTCEFALEGAIFYDTGDDVWENDVAASVLYNRAENIWQFWVCSFSHGHILGHGTSKADLRYGINVVDVELMKEQFADDDRAFAAKENDEDPDFVYDPERKKWYMAICRTVEDESGINYRYFMFESDKPFEGYKYVTQGTSGSETGGSFVKIGGKYYFVCGSSFNERAMYHIYPAGDFSRFTPIKCDYDDGGFRGWGTIFPVPCGNRTKYQWLTFDRHLGSDWNWSYGNIYIFESDIMNYEN